MRLLRTNSVEETFSYTSARISNLFTQARLPRELAKTILAEVKFSSRNQALQNKRKTSRIVKIFIQIINMISSHAEQAGSLLWLETQRMVCGALLQILEL